MSDLAASHPLTSSGKSDLQTWSDFLDSRIDRSWKPGEWFHHRLVFVGDPDNPMSRVKRCSRPGCQGRTSTQGLEALCAACGTLLTKLGGDRAALFAQPLADRRSRAQRNPDCLVTLRGRQCQREAWSNGLCSVHSSRFREWTPPTGYQNTVTDFVASGRCKPLPAFATCAVHGCLHETRSRGTSLCHHHYGAFQRDNRGYSEAKFASVSRPRTVTGGFALGGLPPVITKELLLACQIESAKGYATDPRPINQMVAMLDDETSRNPHLQSILDLDIDTFAVGEQNRYWLRRAWSELRLLRAVLTKVDPMAGDLWDAEMVQLQREGQPGRKGPRRASFDFTPVRQDWLRELLKTWARDMRPTERKLRDAIRAFTEVSIALSTRRGGNDRSTAGVKDVSRAVQSLRETRRPDGELYSNGHLRSIVTALKEVLAYGRSAGLMEGIPDGFAVTKNHAIGKDERPEAPGRALPDSVMKCLNDNIATLGLRAGTAGTSLSPQEAQQLFQAAFIVLRDTGRRPEEVAKLRVGCVSTDPASGEYVLTYDNRKGSRRGRRLPIPRSTAEAILAWEQVLAKVDRPRQVRSWLFPSSNLGRVDGFRHVTTSALAAVLKRWVEQIPDMPANARGDDGWEQPFDVRKITPYAFRHSYAQRHADAGVDPGTLRDLMDHVSISTTMGYYKIGWERKQKAVEVVGSLAADYNGKPRSFDGPNSYEVGSVAVPFGNCTEPTNVKAGGQKCPIRFRCAGCSMYRADPSYLPVIEEHINSLRANLVIAEATEAADWVVTEMAAEIAQFTKIVRSIKRRVEALPEDEQREVAEASVALRRLRASRTIDPGTMT